MDMQNVSNLQIPEGAVRTIHDKDNRLIWGRLAYDTKYAGDTYQQTYSGKNLLPSNTVGTTTSHNVTITVDKTGRITVNGTADANVYFDLNKVTLTAGSYMLSGVPFNGSSSSFRIAFNFGGTIQSLFSVNGKAFTLNSTYTATEAFLYIAKNYTANNLVFEPMIESGSSKTSYEPYVGGVPAPNPDYPETVNVVTGEQTVTISDGVDSEDFTISLGTIELCKIGTYQDYIYKSGDDWYVHKVIGYTDLATQTWGGARSELKPTTTITDIKYVSSNQEVGAGLAEKYIMRKASGMTTAVGYIAIDTSAVRVNTGDASITPTGLFYYALVTPTDTKITDATLVGQLNAIHEWMTRYGYNSVVTGNLPIIIDRTNL